MKFKDLSIGYRFIYPEKHGQNHCKKISNRQYQGQGSYILLSNDTFWGMLDSDPPIFEVSFCDKCDQNLFRGFCLNCD